MDGPVHIINPLEQRIVETFNLFDMHGDKLMDIRHIGTVLRFLGCVPSQEDIKEIIDECGVDEKSGEVHLVDFVPSIVNRLMDQRMKPASPEELLAAFRVLDPETRNYLTKEYVSKLWTEVGEVFSEEELKEMLAVAYDPLEGNIPYQFYINQLKHTPKDSIYELAEAERKKMGQSKQKKGKGRRSNRYVNYAL